MRIKWISSPLLSAAITAKSCTRIFLLMKTLAVDVDITSTNADLNHALVSESTTREADANNILPTLAHFGLDLQNLRGQGYDGAANTTNVMRGSN